MKSPLSRARLSMLAVLATVATLSLVMWSCSDQQVETPTSPRLDRGAVSYGFDHPQIQTAMRTQDRHTPDLMGFSGVVGTATSVLDNGKVVIKVYTENELPAGKLPDLIEGIEVVQQVTGKLVARKGPPPMDGGGDCTVSPQDAQSAPIKLGTSGGWQHDLANGYCCGGTLGGLIQIGGNQYVLSNYHVLYADIVDGGNNRTAQAGDNVIQPALIDVGCNAASSINVATLVNNGGTLPDENIDAGIAQVIPGQVASDGEVLCIGVPSSSTVSAFVGQAVKKMGRTTGLGRADVDGINATVSITYENECAGGTAFTKTYTGQIVTTNNRCRFLDGGDSGSVMFEDVDTNPRAVGLLFAGSSNCNKRAVAIANPINDVLNHYNASMVGN